MMRKRFDEEMQQLRNDFISMASLVDKSVAAMTEALPARRTDLVEELKSAETDAYHYERLLERRCTWLLVYQQPVATDLRLIKAYLKMIVDARRIATQAADMSELLASSAEKFDYTRMETLLKMADAVHSMTYDAIHAFTTKSESLARDIVRRDDYIDTLFLEVRQDIVKGLKKDMYKPSPAIDALMIAKYLEKIADHAVSIAKWTIFAVSGKEVNSI